MSSLIYLFYLYTTIRPKLGVTLTVKFILFLIVANFVSSTAFIFLPLQSYPYISYTIFIEVLLLYFVFCTLYLWLYEVLTRSRALDSCCVPSMLLRKLRIARAPLENEVKEGCSYAYDLEIVAGLYKKKRKTRKKMTEIIMIYR